MQLAPSVIDRLDAEALGGRIRTLRKTAGLTIREVGERLGISTSAVSQIERGALRPSVSRLIAIVQVLGVPLADVFDEDDATPPAASEPGPGGYLLARSGAAHPVTMDGGVTFRRLSPGHMRGVDFFESTYPPGSDATEATGQLITHEGYEVGTVSAGALTIEFPDETVVMRAGDSITFPCTLPHRMRNDGTVPAVATWLIVHA
jgi:DNA-binding XRE family transcriptional regulator/mannose-6-phosphate isomerase-like protein (cupin superfamily)